MRIHRLAAAAALLVLLLVVAGAAAVAGDVGPEEIAGKARANEEEAVLATELGKLRAKVAALEASIVAITLECTETLEKATGAILQNIATLQNEHGKPDVNSLLQKAKEWAKPHVETAKTKWIPVIKENWATAKTNTEPYVQMVPAKSVEVYQASRDAISAHALKAHEFADPYFQEAKKLSKPYIDQVAKASKPHVEKLKTTLKPYTDKAGSAYEKFLGTANLYQQQKEQESGEEPVQGVKTL
ncbi:uncharacterized protein LOC124657246 [Lolium rigidum]|uniref:uncharacterized protein LOC124655712 n=1 Tax=Lolium rigidum TaxID=89674 RepID=UPI001F5D9D59|nr:uncharacterized protein LOC124655712 [Lolium rigidum]XP_047051784.1 uncharacterized protein LOC124657246 [Lolium rigidum]